MILIRLNEDNFQYDIYSLTKAFFPEEEVKTILEDQEIQSMADRVLEIQYQREQVVLRFIDKESSGKTVEQKFSWNSMQRKLKKNQLKIALYRMLQEITQKELPWGNLTGIRPVKIAMGMLEQGMSEENTAKELADTYCMSQEKVQLGMEIAKRELEVLHTFDYKTGYSLYVGIPFCPTTCLYCSFTSYPIGLWRERTEAYLVALFQELSYVAERMKGKRLDSVYIGGGTPTTLTGQQLERLIHTIRTLFDCSQVKEFCVEAGRPDSITREKLKVLRQCGVERISINPQTMNQDTLRVIGRQHTVEDIKRAFWEAREIGFTTINMDIILGLPGEGIEELSHTLDEIEQLAPQNLTVHSLALKRAARLNIQLERYKDSVNCDPVPMMEEAQRRAKAMGLVPYYLYRQKNMGGNLENVGYAKPGHIGLYNILIMEEKQTIVACGAGASTKRVWSEPNPDGTHRIERCENVKDVAQYMERIDEMIERKQKLFEET